MQHPLLCEIGSFPATAQALLDQHLQARHFSRNELICPAGRIARSVYFVAAGACYQFQEKELDNRILDLHLPGEWMTDHASLVRQQPAAGGIRAFEDSCLLELSLESIHQLIAHSPAFLQLSAILVGVNTRAEMFDQALSPVEKYRFITRVKPTLANVFPVKMIASYLKIAPETLSRVRARY